MMIIAVGSESKTKNVISNAVVPITPPEPTPAPKPAAAAAPAPKPAAAAPAGPTAEQLHQADELAAVLIQQASNLLQQVCAPLLRNLPIFYVAHMCYNCCGVKGHLQQSVCTLSQAVSICITISFTVMCCYVMLCQLMNHVQQTKEKEHAFTFTIFKQSY